LAQLFTCSYAAFKPEMRTPVRITLGGPRRPEPTGRDHWLYVAELAPKGWYFKAPADVFARRCTEQLDRLADDIDAKLAWLTEEFGGPIVLLCWEKRVRGPEDCRRRWAAWWTERTGIEVPELDGKA
jgi:hypothetical protein